MTEHQDDLGYFPDQETKDYVESEQAENDAKNMRLDYSYKAYEVYRNNVGIKRILENTNKYCEENIHTFWLADDNAYRVWISEKRQGSIKERCVVHYSREYLENYQLPRTYVDPFAETYIRSNMESENTVFGVSASHPNLGETMIAKHERSTINLQEYGKVFYRDRCVGYIPRTLLANCLPPHHDTASTMLVYVDSMARGHAVDIFGEHITLPDEKEVPYFPRSSKSIYNSLLEYGTLPKQVENAVLVEGVPRGSFLVEGHHVPSCNEKCDPQNGMHYLGE